MKLIDPPRRRAAVLQRVRASAHFRVRESQRFDSLEVAAAVGERDRHSVLHEVDAAHVERALQARAANRQARFFAPKRGCAKTPGLNANTSGECGCATALVVGGADDIRAAGNTRGFGACSAFTGSGRESVRSAETVICSNACGVACCAIAIAEQKGTGHRCAH